MLPGKKYTPDDILRILRKRWWIPVIPAVIGLIVASMYSYTMPNRFRSQTVIMVTHEPDIAAHAERVVVLRDGRVETDQVSRGAAA